MHHNAFEFYKIFAKLKEIIIFSINNENKQRKNYRR